MFTWLAQNAKDIGVILGIVGLAAWTFLRERQEWLARKNLNLAPNPLRCTAALDRISKLEGKVDAIEKDVKEVKDDVKQVRDLHIKA